MKQHNKLVRDKIIEIIEKDGVKAKSRILEDEDYKHELLQKILQLIAFGESARKVKVKTQSGKSG